MRFACRRFLCAAAASGAGPDSTPPVPRATSCNGRSRSWNDGAGLFTESTGTAVPVRAGPDRSTR